MITEGLALAEKRMLSQKAHLGQKVIVSDESGNIKTVSARSQYRKLYEMVK